MLPLSQNKNISTALGTRHRAAIGMSKESDSLVVVVSEETGKISVAKDGNLIADVREDTLKKMLALSNPTYIELKSSFPLNITYQKLLDYVMFCDRLVENALNKKDIVSIKKIGFSVDEYNIYVNSLTKKYIV